MTNDKIQMTNESSISNKKYNIQERALDFATRAANFVAMLQKDMTAIEYCKQLIRSSASVGANIEEADGTLSKKDFINRIAIGRREARESRYWLRLIQRTTIAKTDDLNNENNWLINESHELLLILSSIIKKSKYNK